MTSSLDPVIEQQLLHHMFSSQVDHSIIWAKLLPILEAPLHLLLQSCHHWWTWCCISTIWPWSHFWWQAWQTCITAAHWSLIYLWQLFSRHEGPNAIMPSPWVINIVHSLCLSRKVMLLLFLFLWLACHLACPWDNAWIVSHHPWAQWWTWTSWTGRPPANWHPSFLAGPSMTYWQSTLPMMSCYSSWGTPCKDWGVYSTPWVTYQQTPVKWPQPMHGNIWTMDHTCSWPNDCKGLVQDLVVAHQVVLAM